MRQLLRRLVFYLVALWASVTINFLIPRLVPGNPAEALLARMQGRVNPAALHALEIQFGISNASLWDQYWQYIDNLLHGNLGISITYFPMPVSLVMAQELPWTLVLVGVAVIISFVLGTFIGMFIAWRHGSFADSVLPPFLNLFSSVPYFWLALILLYVLGFKLNLFPLSGGYDIDLNPGLSGDFIASAVGHAILPALTIVISSMAGWMLGMRNTMITTLTEDYVLMARAKGLSDLKVMYAYAARNAILPNITGFALALGFIVGGALFTEIVFSYPGIGYALMQAVQNADYPLVQGIFLVISMAVLAANLLADLINTALDPRTR